MDADIYNERLKFRLTNNEIKGAGLIAAAYEMSVPALINYLRPLQEEMAQLGEFNYRTPTFNKKQLDLLYQKLGRPVILDRPA